MTKQLYEEALADVRKLTAVAEDNAKRAIVEAVTPRIKQLIEKELLSEDMEDDDELLFDDEAVPTTMPQSPVPVAAVAGDPASSDAISPPDAEGKVTLDLDALDVCAPGTSAGTPVPPPMFGEPVPAPPEEEYVLGLESLTSLEPVINSSKKFVSTFNKLAESVRQLKAVGPKLRQTVGYSKQIARTISRVENMYDYVQERVTDPARKQMLEQKLENYFQELTKLQELKMSKKLKDLIKEDDAQLDLGGADDAAAEPAADAPGELTLKLTGLPDDVNLDNVGVDLVAAADDAEGGEEDFDLGGDEGGEEAGDDMGDLDLGGAEGDETGDQMESVHLSDDTIVEIDENMLRREIARMKKLREQSDDKVPSNAGAGVDAAAMDDFGGGAEEGEPFLDGEVTTEAEEMDEADEVMDEADDMAPEMTEMQNRRKADEHGVSANTDMQSVAYEGLKRRIGFEKRLQERAKARAAALKKEAAAAKPSKKAELQKEYAEVAKRHNASVARTKKFSEQLAESVKKLKESRSNSGSPASGVKADERLRKQLAEQNLLNVKLVYANKLLQNESLTKRQKAQVIERLDDAKTVREAKLVYESLVKALAGNKSSSLKEARETRVLGSSSRATRPGATPQNLNEGFETDRWAQLAGITKRA